MEGVGEFTRLMIEDDRAYRSLKKAYIPARNNAHTDFEWKGAKFLTKFVFYLFAYVDDERQRRKFRWFDDVKGKWVRPK